MTGAAWGVDAPFFFDDRELRRLVHHLRGALATVVDDPTVRDALREHRRAWRARMEAGAAAGCQDRWANAEESREASAQGERGKGRHRPRPDEADEDRPDRGGSGSRRRGSESGETGGFGWGPGPFGPFGPFGAFGPGGRGPGRGFRGRGPGWRFEGGRGRAGRGDVRLAILALLSEGPRHGYQLIQDITERSEGAWAPSPGSIYPALSSLQDEGLIDDEKLEGRRVFSLTPAGRSYVNDRQEQIDAVFVQNSPTSEHEALADVGALMWGVGEAALTVLGTGTESQRAEARALLARTRRDLFRILAEDLVPSADARSADAEEAPKGPVDGQAGAEGRATADVEEPTEPRGERGGTEGPDDAATGESEGSSET